MIWSGTPGDLSRDWKNNLLRWELIYTTLNYFFSNVASDIQSMERKQKQTGLKDYAVILNSNHRDGSDLLQGCFYVNIDDVKGGTHGEEY